MQRKHLITVLSVTIVALLTMTIAMQSNHTNKSLNIEGVSTT